jgi:hypothetical protein
VLKVAFLKQCAEIKEIVLRIEARTAFVTFDSEEGYQRALMTHYQPFLERFLHFKPKTETLYKVGHGPRSLDVFLFSIIVIFSILESIQV